MPKLLYFQELGAAGQVAVAGASDYDDIFQAHPAHTQIIESGLNRYHMARP